MSRLELLNSRGFRDEKHLAEFLENCKDEAWKAELIEYFGTDTKTKKSGRKTKEVVEDVPEVEDLNEKELEELSKEFPELNEENIEEE